MLITAWSVINHVTSLTVYEWLVTGLWLFSLHTDSKACSCIASLIPSNKLMWHLQKQITELANKKVSKRDKNGDFPGGPGVKNSPANARDAGLIPCPGTNILHASGQPGPRAAPCKTTTEPALQSLQATATEPPTYSLCSATRSPHTPTHHNYLLLMDCSPPGSSVYGILQATILEWVALPFSRGSSWPTDPTWVSWLDTGLLVAGRFFTVWVTGEV